MVLYEKATGLKREFDSLHRFISVLNSKAYSILLEESLRANQEVAMQVPVKTGRLKSGSTIYLSPSSRKTRPEIIGIASAIDPNSGYDYADIQHNDTSLRHPNGGKANFIADPFNDMVDRIESRFEEELGYAP